eukprot:4678291-Pyramimonas_sp.AAC.1
MPVSSSRGPWGPIPEGVWGALPALGAVDPAGGSCTPPGSKRQATLRVGARERSSGMVPGSPCSQS